MGEGLSHWSSMVLRKSQTYFFDRHTHPNSMYSNFCHVLKNYRTINYKPLLLVVDIIWNTIIMPSQMQKPVPGLPYELWICILTTNFFCHQYK